MLRPPRFHLEPALPGDAQALASLRVVAMRASLERIGRFDPRRARTRFLADYEPEHTRHVVTATGRVGFVVLRRQRREMLLEHLYLLPAAQGQGLGSAVLRVLVAAADIDGLAMRVGTLRGSAANRFYLRHGFELVEQARWDSFYIRPARHVPDPSSTALQEGRR